MSQIAKQLRDAADQIEVLEYQLAQRQVWLNLQIDSPVMYRVDRDRTWRKGHFAGMSSMGAAPFPTVWQSGATSWTTGAAFSVSECREPTAQELA